MACPDRAATSKVWEVRLGLEIAYCPCGICLVDGGTYASELSDATLSSVGRDHVLAAPSFHLTADTVLDESKYGMIRGICVFVMEELEWSLD